MSERLGLDRLRASVLVTLGAARMNIHGAKAGQDELRRGLELALVLNDSGSVQRAYNNIGEGRWIAMETDALVPLYGEARRFAERFANAWALRWIDAQTAVAHLYLGHWDEAGRITRRYLESLGGESDYLESQVRLLLPGGEARAGPAALPEEQDRAGRLGNRSEAHALDHQRKPGA